MEVIPGRHELAFDAATNLLFLRREALPGHSNGLRFVAFDGSGEVLLDRTCYSVGGGFKVQRRAPGAARRRPPSRQP